MDDGADVTWHLRCVSSAIRRMIFGVNPTKDAVVIAQGAAGAAAESGLRKRILGCAPGQKWQAVQ